MELIKRKILLEDSRDRNYNSKDWGKLTATTFYVNVFLTQSIDDMGIFIDTDYIVKNSSSSPVDYSILYDKLYSLGITDIPFMNNRVPSFTPEYTNTDLKTLRLTGNVASNYYDYGELPVTGLTDSKIEDLKSYSNANPYQTNFDINKEIYYNYKDIKIIGVDRIKSMSEPRIYVFDTPKDNNLGTPNQKYGLQYIEYTGNSRYVKINNEGTYIPITSFYFRGEGWNKLNTSLSALTKNEFLFGIVSRPEVESDIFIDRGVTRVLDYHLRLSEIGNIGELTNYGNGFYKINRQ